MSVLETLLSKRWIIKSREKELYYQVKEELGSIKKFLNEKLGYQVIVNPYLIKIEKMPAKPENWMGISEFNEKIEYVFLCIVLMFLEDKEAEEQFVLSELTEYIQSEYKEAEIDWNSYSNRRHLVKVMKFCVSCGMLNIDDGSEESFAKDDTSEVLYENTGVSKYFTKNFTQNIMDFEKPEDFQREDWIDVNEERGIVRRQRVYRSLLMSTGMYKTDENEEDFAYIRNYRNMISGELSELFNCDLQVHRTSAYLILREDCRLGKTFPEENTLSDIILLCNTLLRKEIEEKKIQVPVNEQIKIPKEQFRSLLESCKRKYGSGFNKTCREMSSGEFYRTVKEQMIQMEFIEETKGSILLRPIMGKIMGEYPRDFNGGGDNE
jgi:uncharacterized protein (TIGR02678 family)